MCATCEQLFVVSVQDRHVDTIFRTETVMVQCSLFPNFVGESLLHLIEERVRVTTRISPVYVRIFSWILFPRRGWNDAEVVQGRHCRSHWPLNHAPSGFLSHIGRGGSPSTGDVNFPKSVSHFLALEFEPGTKLIQRKPDSWVPFSPK